MQLNRSAALVLASGIVLAALLVCGTLVALNVRTTYPMTQVGKDGTWLRLLQKGCTLNYGPTPDPIAVAVSCPVWITP